MTPLQSITKAAYEAEWGPGSWDLVSEDRQMERCRYMSAGLMALAAFDFKGPHLLPDEAFKARLRTIATENTDG
jgi:hypothetical protein